MSPHVAREAVDSSTRQTWTSIGVLDCQDKGYGVDRFPFPMSASIPVAASFEVRLLILVKY